MKNKITLSKIKKENIFAYIISIVSIVIVAVVGGIFSGLGQDWYTTLNFPSQWVPSFLFSVVWSTIYALFAIYLIYSITKNTLSKQTTLLLIINGVLNILWTLVFFTLQNTLLGLVVILINLIFAFMLIKSISKTNNVFSYILFVYCVWLSIATCLNIAIWILN